MKRTLEEMVKAMKLVPIDDEFRLSILTKYGQTLDDKYRYRTIDGNNVYSVEYLLGMSMEGEK